MTKEGGFRFPTTWISKVARTWNGIRVMHTSKCFLFCAMAFLASSLTTPEARSQSVGLWGGWNDYGNSWQGTKPSRDTPRLGGWSVFNFGQDEAFPAIMDGGPRPLIEPRQPEIVSLPNQEAAGTILIDTEGRRLYFTLSSNAAYAYPISVGREGFTWSGTETVSRIAAWPDWHPPKEMLERDPRLPDKMYGGIRNPLGAIALFLGNSLYRIHGTNDAKTIGIAASSGCFRMLNEHVVHLAMLAHVGTTVKVLQRLAGPDVVTEELPWLRKPLVAGVSGAGGE